MPSLPLPLNHERLVVLLRRAALIAAPAVSLGLSACGPCAGAADDIFLLRNPDAETQALIEACRAPVNPNCTPLCTKVSGQGFFEHCELHADRDGYVQVHVGNAAHCPGGRRPRRLTLYEATTPVADFAVVGTFFARQFQLEAASVPAFQVLREELTDFGAPAALRHAATAAARDEVRHARALSMLARRYGVQARAPRVGVAPPRELGDFAVHNAIEGCVRETYGAVLALVQARASQDPTVRAAMQRIATDEIRHAGLAFSIDAWASKRLSLTARARIAAARAASIDELEGQSRDGWTPALGAAAGLPDPGIARSLLAELRETVWI